jgi:hypothetical protein
MLVPGSASSTGARLRQRCRAGRASAARGRSPMRARGARLPGARHRIARLDRCRSLILQARQIFITERCPADADGQVQRSDRTSAWKVIEQNGVPKQDRDTAAVGSRIPAFLITRPALPPMRKARQEFRQPAGGQIPRCHEEPHLPAMGCPPTATEAFTWYRHPLDGTRHKLSFVR